MKTEETITFKEFAYQLLKPFRWQLGLLLLFIVYESFFWVYNPYLLKKIIDLLSEHCDKKAQVWEVISSPLSMYLITWGFAITAYRATEWVNRSIYPALRQNTMQHMFAHVIEHTHDFFQDHPSGGVSNRILDMQNGLTEILSLTFQFLFNISLFLISSSFLFFIHPSIIMVLLIWLAVFTIITLRYSPHVIQNSHTFSQEKTNLVGHLVDAIGNVNIIRMFSQTAYEAKRFHQIASTTAEHDRALRLTIFKMRILWEISIFSALTAFLWILVNLYQSNLATIGDFAFVTSTFIGVIHNIWNLMNQYVQFSEELGKCQQALHVMQPISIQDHKDSYAIKHVEGKITFQDVSFSHGADHQIFKNKSITVPAKQKVGLVGFSGSGKSTFINLVLRLYDIESGNIFIDEHALTDLKLDTLRQLISLIPQEPSLLNRTIIENIQYGCPAASEEEIITASKLAHCHEFITELPDGYQTTVGEKGTKLSGGQRQRIAIARAFLKQAPILILDEATSALDSVTENYVQDSLNQLFKDRTTFVIAHRLSTLSKMDRILVFDQGEIIEDGTHTELISHGGPYSEMWLMQSGGFIYDHTD